MTFEVEYLKCWHVCTLAGGKTKREAGREKLRPVFLHAFLCDPVAQLGVEGAQISAFVPLF